ncbi:MAG TPA: hypothetical protein EYG26_02570 [Planctomycetes bacterium]|nr:hypothetical protein [Planctomycetota bacterium]
MPRHRFAAVCPFCASGSVIDRAVDRETIGSGRAIEPNYVLGFAIPREQAEASVREWLAKGRLLAPSEIRHAKISSMEGVYLPAYLYSAVARSEYSARIGENYTTTETYVTTDSKGRMVTRTRTVVKTEWRNLSGKHVTQAADALVTACRGLTNAELAAIEPFDLSAIRRYSSALVTGWSAEEATRTQAEGIDLAQEEVQQAVGRELDGYLPGDSRQVSSLTTTFEDQVAELMLVPVWVLALRWGPEKKLLRVLVNGQTGEIQGDLPRSFGRLALLVLGILAVLVFFGLIVSGMFL